mmetsp:Transcript_77846/g.223536  ORF Transcript_77846/g.223536 Transcript_77846/m.223536 type:complete len:235 (+) Transcript_77846:1015-1719(+)
MAAEAVKVLREAAPRGTAGEENVELSFFTAGTGNAGATIVSATFLLLAQKALTYAKGTAEEREPWTDERSVDFGEGVGERTVRLLDNPDVYTTQAALGVDGLASRFSTAPPVWNRLFGAAKILPDALLGNDEAMMSLSLFSLPIIRAVDALVGATNAMRVDASNDQQTVTFRVTHNDLEDCVGLGTAAFACELLAGTIPPGVLFPPELEADARGRILERVKRDALVWEIQTRQR